MKHILVTLSFLITCGISFSQQGLGIGTTTPAASAMLEVKASNKGLLPPRVELTSITDVTTIVSPATGLVVFNTATSGASPNNVTPGYYFFTGVNWLKIGTQGNNPGDMQYWNGKQWVILPAGTHNQELSICNGVPKWGPCSGNPGLPTVVTSRIANVDGIIVTCVGNVTASGGSTVLSRGICYKRTANPTIADSSIVDDSSGTGIFITKTLRLAENTTYHVRAFATNATGTAYGADSVFTTSRVFSPLVYTILPFGIGSTTAYSGGIIANVGGAPVTARGIEYGFFNPPNQFFINLFDDIVEIDTFSLQMTGLLPNTTYFVRANACNNGYTNCANSNTLSFKTLPAGYFAGIYLFDSLNTNSGLTDPSPVPVVTGLSFSACKGTGAGLPSLNSTVNKAFSLTGWSLGATDGSNLFTNVEDTATKYYEFTLTPNTGRNFNLTAVKFKWQRSGTGPRQVFMRSSIDNYTNNLSASISPNNSNLAVVFTNKFQVNDAATAGQDGCTITLTGPSFTGITVPVKIRIYGINAENVNGTFSIDNVVFNGIVN